MSEELSLDVRELDHDASIFDMGRARHRTGGRERLAVDDVTCRACKTSADFLLVGGMNIVRIADVDGDYINDVIGAGARIFVRTSRTRTIQFLGERARGIAVGDVDGDGIAEPVYLTEDGAAVRRVYVATDGTLTSDSLLDVGGDLLAVADVDANDVADILLARKTKTADSSVVLYRR